GGENLGDGVFYWLLGLFVDNAENRWKRLTCRSLVRPSRQCFGNRVEQGDSPLGVGGDDRIADTGQRHPQLLPLSLDHPGIPFGAPTGRLFFEQAAGVLFGLLALRQVTGDLEEAPDLAGLVPQGGDDDAGPEPRSVLAQSPALLLGPALSHRHAQLVGRPSP